ncbi:carbon-nitrogen hydrolase family protein [Govanella unica]|uniref:Carbon-nitrogen hydrolase family protein n=1 Tax=Govanella unica TaxID=2975056 RepID=A0A9X3TZ74_9PROT|nr:carbon-nitrogen hydrolase family protein [Govania unica]MDA5194503.1 carbon-nitrogen hydrolase family protein [Govania unica]
MKIAVIQMNAQTDKAANLARALRLMTEAKTLHAPDLIVLPENFTCYSTDAAIMAANAEAMPGGPAYEALAAFARTHKVAVHAGSMSERTADKPFNTSVVFDRDGREIARYRKIHRFDITAPDGTAYHESAVVGGGRDIVTYELDGLTFGCAICFDLRFGELFTALRSRGADVIVIPSAFTHVTGEAHWNVLIRARAIENQCYMIAPNQHGGFDNGAKANWGHSLMVDPWGAVLAEARADEAILIATIDKAAVRAVRERIPVETLRVLG